VLLASDHPDASQPLFAQTGRDTQRYGFVGLEFANELGLAEFARNTSRRAEAQARLRSLQKAASAKSFGLIASKAAQELSTLDR
jgi:hypothetical protein